MVAVTSAVGVGQASGFLRNLEGVADATSLGTTRVSVSSFPPGYSNGTTLIGGCAYPNKQALLEDEQRSQILAEGIDARARNEFLCMSGQGEDAIEAIARSAVLGGLGLTTPDLKKLLDA